MIRYIIHLSILLFACQLSSFAQGDLLIAPMRVIFEGDKQKEEVGLTNIGKDTAFYSISFIQNDMREDGSFIQISDTASGKLFASTYVRIFPRRVVLAPGESQTIRLQLRKRQDMEIGEYRSHLYFRSDNEKRRALGDKEKEQTKGIGVQLKAVFGLSIPIIIRNGKTSSTTQLTNVSLKLQNDTFGIISTTINRSGNESCYGDLVAEYINNKSESTIIGRMRGIGIYTSTNKRLASFAVQIKRNIDLSKGKIRLKYITTKNEPSTSFCEHIFPIKQ